MNLFERLLKTRAAPLPPAPKALPESTISEDPPAQLSPSVIRLGALGTLTLEGLTPCTVHSRFGRAGEWVVVCLQSYPVARGLELEQAVELHLADQAEQFSGYAVFARSPVSLAGTPATDLGFSFTDASTAWQGLARCALISEPHGQYWLCLSTLFESTYPDAGPWLNEFTAALDHFER